MTDEPPPIPNPRVRHGALPAPSSRFYNERSPIDRANETVIVPREPTEKTLLLTDVRSALLFARQVLENVEDDLPDYAAEHADVGHAINRAEAALKLKKESGRS